MILSERAMAWAKFERAHMVYESMLVAERGRQWVERVRLFLEAMKQ